MPTPRRVVYLSFVLLTVVVAVADPRAESIAEQDRAARAALRGPALGLLVEGSRIAELPSAPSTGDRPAPLVRVTAIWSEVERERSVFDWSPIEAAVEAARAAGYRVVLALAGTNPRYAPDGGPPSPLVPESLAGWVEFVRGAARRFGDRVLAYEVAGAAIGEGEFDPDLAALVLKQSALAVRAEAEARGTSLLVAQPALPAGAIERQRELWARDSAAYVDVLPVAFDPPAANVAAILRELAAESALHPPAPALWAYVAPASGWQGPALAVEALSAGAAAALVAPPDDERSATEEASWIVGLDSLLAGGFGPAPLGAARLVARANESAPTEARVLGRFFDEEDFSAVVVYQAPHAAEPPPSLQLLVDAPGAREARLWDPLSGEAHWLPAAPAAGRHEQAFELDPAGPALGVVLFQQGGAVPGLELPPEELAVAETRGLTAQEIIARHQAVQREQDERLERFTTRGRVDLHFKLGESATTVDVSIDSQYFWERGGQLEWEQREYFINGNRVKWKHFPQLPLIQPEKVVTLPLDLTLNRTYTYRLIGEDRVDEHEAYVLEFQPADPASPLSLYRGRVWIDKRSFARLKLSLVQSNLEPPVLSNEEIDRFEEQPGPAGDRYRLFSRIEGQQVWNVTGRTFVVHRELSFRDWRINPPAEELEALRRQAYASDNQMLRDTDHGFRYLERTPEGSRVVREHVDSSQLFAGAGVFKDSSLEHPVPLGAVNYFNYDVAHKNIQINALFAGVLGFFTASKPDLAGGRMDATLDAGFSALSFDDKLFGGDVERRAERLESRPQRLALRIGRPLGEFFKLNLIGGLTWRSYDLAGEARAAIREFNNSGAGIIVEYVVPRDHLELGATLEGRLNRRGWVLVGDVTRASRSDWSAFGLRDTPNGEFGRLDPAGGGFLPETPEPLRRRFTRWRATTSKEWYLPRFQRLRAEVSRLDGSALDRFSRYQFSFFGEDRLNGFAGSGVRFDRGWIGRAGYAFNLLGLIRFELGVDTARVEERDAGTGAQRFTGAGLAANFVAPWKTVVSLSYGRALAADIPGLEGEQEFLLLVLKLF